MSRIEVRLMVHAVGIVVMLVVLGTAVATFAGRWGMPAPSLLVLAGIVVALIPGVPAIHVAPDVIALVVLPPLLYASAEEISARDLRWVWVPVTVLALALGLVLATAAVIASLALALTDLSGAMAFVLGAVLASTDPVAVTALGRRLSLPGRRGASCCWPVAVSRWVWRWPRRWRWCVRALPIRCWTR